MYKAGSTQCMVRIRGASCGNVFKKIRRMWHTVCFDVSIYRQISKPDVTNERMTHLLKLDTFFIHTMRESWCTTNTNHASCGSSFRVQSCQKYGLYEKMLQIKLAKNSISYKKLSGRTCLSPPRVELRDSKNCHVWNIIIFPKGEIQGVSK